MCCWSPGRYRAGEGRAYSGLGIAYGSQGQYGKAIEYHTQDLAIAEEVGDRAGEGRANNNLGIARQKSGDLLGAARALGGALVAYQRVEDGVEQHDVSRVSVLKEQQRSYRLLQSVLLELGRGGGALGVLLARPRWTR